MTTAGWLPPLTSPHPPLVRGTLACHCADLCIRDCRELMVEIEGCTLCITLYTGLLYHRFVRVCNISFYTHYVHSLMNFATLARANV